MLKYDIDRNSLIRSSLHIYDQYGNVVWDNLNKHEANLLESVQLDAARIISSLRRGTSHAIHFKELVWVPLSERRKNQT